MRAMHRAAAVAVMAAATLAAPYASAHASLKSSSPAAGAVLAEAPRQITLTFNEKIEAAFSTVGIADAQGKEVPAAKAKVDAANPVVMYVDVPTLAAGTYTVKWAVAGHDGHRRQGQFSFTVK